VKKEKKDPRDEPVEAVLMMAEQIEEARNNDQGWTSWDGNGTNAFEANNVIRPLEKIALRCKK
jgi:hypothetical protein